VDFAARDREALCVRLVAHIHHLRVAVLIEMSQCIWHNKIIS